MIVIYAVSVLVTVLPNTGDFAVAAHSTKSFGAVSDFLIYSANNPAFIAASSLPGSSTGAQAIDEQSRHAVA